MEPVDNSNAGPDKGESEKAAYYEESKIESSGSIGHEFQLLERAGTKRNIKSRHAQMIAIGGTIGTGLFLGSGQALAIGGPGTLFIAYSIISLLVYGVVTAVIEVSTYLPISGTYTDGSNLLRNKTPVPPSHRLSNA